jgi:hypothetical protein
VARQSVQRPGRASWALAGAALVAVASLLIPAAPGYDAWAWLLWGREVAGLELDTIDGPAFKPLPVAVTVVLSIAGDAAPQLWLVLARLGALLAVGLAYMVAAALARARGASPFWCRLGGAAAAAGVLFTEGFAGHAAVGDSEPLLIAVAFGAFMAGIRGRHGWALGAGVAAALLRPEVWPFLALYGLWCWVHRSQMRPVLIGAAVAIPLAWFVPEWLGSGELLRSTDRARVANPGQPALAQRPALDSLSRGLGLLFVPTAAAALLARDRRTALLVGSGAGWMALVALMSEAGFSGEERYMLPGAAAVAVGGGAALGRAGVCIPGRFRPAAAVAAGAALAPFAGLGAGAVYDMGPRLASGAQLARHLPVAIREAGGAEALRGCGRPAVGRYRGTLLAYHLDVPKRWVRADGLPADVSFRSRLRPSDPLSPAPAAGQRVLLAHGRWRIESSCSIPPAGVGVVRVP